MEDNSYCHLTLPTHKVRAEVRECACSSRHIVCGWCDELALIAVYTFPATFAGIPTTIYCSVLSIHTNILKHTKHILGR